MPVTTFKRELILARLHEIGEALPGIETALRDVMHFSDDQLPAIGILQGDEEYEENDPPNRPPNAPRVVHMIPGLVIHAGDVPENLGAKLSGLYAALISAITHDATLIGLTVDGRGIRPLGMESDLGLGRTMFGKMATKIRFTYRLAPDEL